MMPDEEPAPPRVTPFLLSIGDRMCPRRLACEHHHEPGSADPVNRARVRNALLDAIRTWHETTAWVTPPGLCSEEDAVVAHACRWYERRFPDPVAEVTLPAESPTVLARRHVTLGGWVDLGVVHLDGQRELRQLVWRGRPLPPDPLEEPSVRLAVLRLACVGWVDEPLTLSLVDLLSGELARARVDGPDALAPIAAWLDERVAVVQTRADQNTVTPGRDCAGCRFVPRCPAHSVRASMFTRRDALVPAMLSLSPTAVDTWARCRREWRDRALLGVPPSDDATGAEHGMLLHRLLHLVHRTGSCQDADHLDSVLTGHGADERTAEEVRRHAVRCPIGAEAVGHEVEWARAYAGPPTFLATARLDAVWVHDGILDVRDYKSGRVAEHGVDEDRAARLQAWVAAPQAAARGLRLRLRYEHLATEVLEDPAPWEPSDDDLAAIEAELTATVSEMIAERTFAGVADAAVCGRCRFHSICDDSATAGTASWPSPHVDAPDAPATAGRP